ncbi:hypothetical protein YQE_09502, partial [Dendroctonus ponderosae]
MVIPPSVELEASRENTLIENDRVNLIDIENGVLGVPSSYRPYFMQRKKISTLETMHVFCFRHVLYEMAIGSPLHESYIGEEISECLHQFIQLRLFDGDPAHFKIPSSIKEYLKIVVFKIEDRCKGEQKLVRSQKRLTKVQKIMISEEDRKKHRNRMKQLKEQKSKGGSMRKNGNHNSSVRLCPHISVLISFLPYCTPLD